MADDVARLAELVADAAHNVANARATLGGNVAAQNEFDRLKDAQIAALAVSAATHAFGTVTAGFGAMADDVARLAELVADAAHNVANARATLGGNVAAQNEFDRLQAEQIAALAVPAATHAYGTLGAGLLAMADDIARLDELENDHTGNIAVARATLGGNVAAQNEFDRLQAEQIAVLQAALAPGVPGVTHAAGLALHGLGLPAMGLIEKLVAINQAYSNTPVALHSQADRDSFNVGLQTVQAVAISDTAKSIIAGNVPGINTVPAQEQKKVMAQVLTSMGL